jgi:hypothetical protein
VVDLSIEENNSECKRAIYCGISKKKNPNCNNLMECANYELCSFSADFNFSSQTNLVTFDPTYYPTFIPTTSNPTFSPTNFLSHILAFAGNGTQGYSGDGGLATNAKINFVFGISADTVGNLFFADFGSHTIRKINNASNIISTVAGNGIQGYSNNGAYATNAKLNYPSDVVVDSIGFYYLMAVYE